MKFTVQFVNECKLVSLGEGAQELNLSNRTFKYDINKNQNLANHITNIHKSLITIGIPIQDIAQYFTLRLHYQGEPIANGIPKYLGEADSLEAELKLLSELKKSIRKSISLEFVLSPQIRAERIAFQLQSKSPLQLKETLFHLRQQLLDHYFVDRFVSNRGIPLLFDSLDCLQGNTLSFAVAAINDTIKTSKFGAEDLLKTPNACKKLLSLIENPSLAVCSRTIEVMSEVCIHGGWEQILQNATESECRGLVCIFMLLQCKDITTRQHALSVLNSLLCHADKNSKELILQQIAIHQIPVALQKSLWIEVPCMVQQIKTFELLSGIQLTQVVRHKTALLKKNLTVLEHELKSLTSQTRERGMTDYSANLSSLPSKSFPSIPIPAPLTPPVSRLRGQSQAILVSASPIQTFVPPSPDPKRKELQAKLDSIQRDNEGLQVEIQDLTQTLKSLLAEKCSACAVSSPNGGPRRGHESRLMQSLGVESARGSARMSRMMTQISKAPLRNAPKLNISNADELKRRELLEEIRKLRAERDELEREKNVIEAELVSRQTENNSSQVDMYQITLVTDRLEREIVTIKSQEEKLSLVVSNLEQKRTHLVSEAEQLKSELNQLQAEVAKRPVLSTQRVPMAELEERLRLLQNTAVTVMADNRVLKERLEAMRSGKS